MTTNYTMCIVGGGPNALYLLERVLAHRLAEPAEFLQFSIHVFDKGGSFGSGCHYSTQPKTNHLNRIATQISFCADPTNKTDVTHLLPEQMRWTLFDWCEERFSETGEERFKISEHSWVDRALFGEASESVFSVYVEQLRNLGIKCTLHKAEVYDIAEGGDTYLVHARAGAEETRLPANFVALCTGHGSNQNSTANGVNSDTPSPQYDQIYPLEQFDAKTIPSGADVACMGMGLAAIDLMLWLTEGRGGYFSTKPGDPLEVVYHCSGFEPAKIIPFSGSGAFPMTRARNQKLNDETLLHKSIFLTYDVVDRLREVCGREVQIANVGVKRQIDFEAHILPIMITEMALVYYGVLFGRAWRDAAVAELTPVFERFIEQCGSVFDLDAGLSILFNPAGSLARRTASNVADIIRGETKHVTTETYAAARQFLKVAQGAEAASRLPDLADSDTFARCLGQELSSPSPWLHSPDPLDHLFDWQSLVDPLGPYADAKEADRRQAAIDRLRWDMKQAEQGNLNNPTKSAIDGVCRDIRDVLRYTVEFGGLTAKSQKVFAAKYQRLLNRLGVGTSLKIMKKILALTENGVVDLSYSRAPQVSAEVGNGWLISGPEHLGENCRAALLLNARVHLFDLQSERSELFQNLAAHGLVRNWYNPSPDGDAFVAGGLDIV